MKKHRIRSYLYAGIIAFFASLNFVSSSYAENNTTAQKKETELSQTERIQLGREVALSRAKGNCVSCHAMPNEPKATEAGTIAPALVYMKTRYPKKEALYDQIWDAHRKNSHSIMPPFGRNKIITEQDLKYLVDFIYEL